MHAYARVGTPPHPGFDSLTSPDPHAEVAGRAPRGGSPGPPRRGERPHPRGSPRPSGRRERSRRERVGSRSGSAREIDNGGRAYCSNCRVGCSAAPVTHSGPRTWLPGKSRDPPRGSQDRGPMCWDVCQPIPCERPPPTRALRRPLTQFCMTPGKSPVKRRFTKLRCRKVQPHAWPAQLCRRVFHQPSMSPGIALRVSATASGSPSR